MTELTEQQVRAVCSDAIFGVVSSAELTPLTASLGQQRAISALQLGTRVAHDGYHIAAYDAGELDRQRTILQLLKQIASERPVPDDWCYATDFADRDSARAIRLPAGIGRAFRDDVRDAITEMRLMLPLILESEEFSAEAREVLGALQKNQTAALERLRQAAEAEGLGLLPTPNGLALAPMQDGEVLERPAFDALPEAEQKRLHAAMERLNEQLISEAQQAPARQREAIKAQRALTRRFTEQTVGDIVRSLRDKYQSFEPAAAWIRDMERDIIDQSPTILALENSSLDPAAISDPLQRVSRERFHDRYLINLVTDNSELNGAPVIQESNPTLEKLIGRVEHRQEFGVMVTDASMLRAGALHRANGGFLVLDATRVLQKPLAWDALKRALGDERVHIESVSEAMGFAAGASIEAEPIPLHCKVILLGPRRLFLLLEANDPEFANLFKVSADFEDHIDRTPETTRAWAESLASLIQDNLLLHFAADALARLVEHGSRQASHQQRLGTRMEPILDLMREADDVARQRDAELVTGDDVNTAIVNQAFRQSRIREEVHEHITSGAILIQTEGTQVGQVNGLSVLGIGQHYFGQPSRISATARLGRGEVIDIERESSLGGRIHSKAVMIVSAFLGARYARDMPLSLSASLTFEQSYGGVEGDSASLAEVCALISAMIDAPIRQDLAITGSMDQYGRAQAIGGVNEKIEGFHDICTRKSASQSPTRTQGVIIPAANVPNLMLRPDVVDAIRCGTFHVHAVTTVDEALALLLDTPAGELDGNGDYPAASINGQVRARAKELHALARQANEPAEKDSEKRADVAPDASPTNGDD